MNLYAGEITALKLYRTQCLDTTKQFIVKILLFTDPEISGKLKICNAVFQNSLFSKTHSLIGTTSEKL